MTSSYVPPIVEVYQEYRSPTAIIEKPFLSAIVVGPCYHILTLERDKSEIYVGDYDATNGNSFAAPSPLAGMQLESEGLTIYVDDGFAELSDTSDGAFDSSDVDLSATVTSASADYIVAKVAVGDVVLVINGAEIASRKVMEVVDANTLLLNKNLGFAASATGMTIIVSREVTDEVISSSFYAVDLGTTIVTLNIGVEVVVDGVLLPLLNGKLYMAYTALNVLPAALPVEISSVEDIETKLGLIDGDKNPLAMGAHVLFGNAQRKVYAIGLTSNDSVGWAKARDIIKARKAHYAKSLLTDDTGIISLYKALEESNQAPETAAYGISIGTHKVEDLEDYEVAVGTEAETLTDPSSSTIIILQDNTADFIEDGVRAGDMLELEGAMAVGNPYLVDEVTNGNKLKVMIAKPFASEATALVYRIHRILDEEELAARVAAVSESFGFKRIVMTFPDSCQIDGEILPGYYTTCVVGGMIAGLPPHAGLTNKGAAVIERVYNSNFKFDEDQLNVIAGGGTMLFVQDDEAALPYIRHQLTTDRTILETAEVSAVKNNDYISFVFKNTIKKFLGIYNVQEGLFTALRPALEADLATLKQSTSLELGPMLISGEILELKQSDISKDSVEVVIDTVQPAPFNHGILRVIA